MVADKVPTSLSAHPIFTGTDVKRARQTVSAVIDPHALRLVDRRRSLDARLYAARVGDVTLMYVRYGADVEISAPGTASCFCVQFPLAGNAEVICGSDRLLSSRRVASVPSPDRPLRMRWAAEAAHLIVRIERTAVDNQLRAMLGDPTGPPLRTQLGLALQAESGQRWMAILELLQAEIGQRTNYGEDQIALRPSAAAVQDLVVNSLLLWHRNNYSERLHSPARPATAPYVRRALDYARAHLDGPLTISGLAEAAGVSIRSPQAGFARDLGCAPSRYVRDLRLERIRADLLATDPAEGTRVTDVAIRWGFSHLGRFSQVYRVRFGEPPSATLRRLDVQRGKRLAGQG